MEDFEIPSHKSELLGQDISTVPNALKDAKADARGGPEFILEHKDAYFSAIFHGDKLSIEDIHDAHQVLHTAMKRLNDRLVTLFATGVEDERSEYLNIVKILVYCYTNIVCIMEEKCESKATTLKVKKSKKDLNPHQVDRKEILVNLHNICQHDIKQLWEPPIVETSFINLISEVCYRFLVNPSFKNDKEACEEIRSLFGTLMKSYNHSRTFLLRIGQLIKSHEHLVTFLPECFKFLVDNFNCKSLIHDLIRELTEWLDKEHQDPSGGKNCSQTLIEMAKLMPDLVLGELVYLDTFLQNPSPVVRNSVLSVITEIIENVLTKHDLTEEQKEIRNGLLRDLEEFMDDTAAVVRAKVMQHFCRLQRENAIPLQNQHVILEKCIEHVWDKAALVRRYAIECVTAFLQCNPYAAELRLEETIEDFENKKIELEKFQKEAALQREEKIKELQNNWDTKIVKNLEDVVDEVIENDESMNTDEYELIDKDLIPQMIVQYLNDKKFTEAVILARTAEQENATWKNAMEKADDKMRTKIILTLLESVYLKLPEHFGINEADIKRFDALQTEFKYFFDVKNFLVLLNNGMIKVFDLLDTTAISDFHAAVEFLTSAYQFNIDNRNDGVLEMLKLMKRPEEDRRDGVISAFKTIYLTTEAKSMEEHTQVIVKRLIELLKFVPLNNLEDLQLIVAGWTKLGVLDNSVIDVLWKYFTGKMENVSPEEARAALDLLKMAATGRKTIIVRNIKLVAAIAFSEKYHDDLLMFASACRIISVVGREKIDVTSDSTPFKIMHSDPMFSQMIDILVDNFNKPSVFYNNTIADAVQCIFRVCSKPEEICEKLLLKFGDLLKENKSKKTTYFKLARLCHFLGCIAINHLDYMDNTIYREIKRRNFIRAERKKEKKHNKNKNIDVTSASGKKRKSTTNLNETNPQNMDESILDGTCAEDADAEFILNVLEKDTVNGSGLLGKFAKIIKDVCQRPDIYNNEIVQSCAVIALIRYMLVSSIFCEENIQLLFTIYEKTTFADVKCTILYHCSDLLSRMPNIVDPWTPRIFKSLDDSIIGIRISAFYTLANLILKDMIRAHGEIYKMAKCLIDESEELQNMSRTFFFQLSHKENLYNVLPDIFSHLLTDCKESVNEENLRLIMSFLFEMMDKEKTKYMENLVERFCAKFPLSEDELYTRNVAFCLTLILYNEKALRKLIESFPIYKHLLHNPEIHASFKQIMTSCSKTQVGKTDLKPIIEELQENINSVFDLNEGDPPTEKAPSKSKGKIQKKQKGRRTKKRVISESESE